MRKCQVCGAVNEKLEIITNVGTSCGRLKKHLSLTLNMFEEEDYKSQVIW